MSEFLPSIVSRLSSLFGVAELRAKRSCSASCFCTLHLCTILARDPGGPYEAQRRRHSRVSSPRNVRCYVWWRTVCAVLHPPSMPSCHPIPFKSQQHLHFTKGVDVLNFTIPTNRVVSHPSPPLTPNKKQPSSSIHTSHPPPSLFIDCQLHCRRHLPHHCSAILRPTSSSCLPSCPSSPPSCPSGSPR